jgi:hypothetical protein
MRLSGQTSDSMRPIGRIGRANQRLLEDDADRSTGDGVFDQTKTDLRVINADGSKVETVSARLPAA